jgi:hypothetical protein
MRTIKDNVDMFNLQMNISELMERDVSKHLPGVSLELYESDNMSNKRWGG